MEPSSSFSPDLSYNPVPSPDLSHAFAVESLLSLNPVALAPLYIYTAPPLESTPSLFIESLCSSSTTSPTIPPLTRLPLPLNPFTTEAERFAISSSRSCLLCNKVYASKDSFRRHGLKAHQPNAKEHKCVEIGKEKEGTDNVGCDSTFIRQDYLQRHYRKVHHFDKPEKVTNSPKAIV
jgi:hypothetical protein